MSVPPFTQPDLLEYLHAATKTLDNAPNLFDRAHPAGDLVAQAGGHFVMASAPDTTARRDPCRQGVWVFLDMGATLDVLTCTVHGNTIDPPRARALGERLIAWASRKEGQA